jgi:hypothetical protein
MPTRALNYLGHHAIAITALICSLLALAGASYAAIGLANHSIDPVNLNPRYIGGYVRAWVSVDGNGHVTASGGGVQVLADSDVAPGHFIIDWRPRPTTPCTAIGSVDFTNGPVPGYVIAQAFAGGRGGRGGEQSTVQTYNPQGQPTALAYDVQLICSTPG